MYCFAVTVMKSNDDWKSIWVDTLSTEQSKKLKGRFIIQSIGAKYRTHFMPPSKKKRVVLIYSIFVLGLTIHDLYTSVMFLRSKQYHKEYTSINHQKYSRKKEPHTSCHNAYKSPQDWIIVKCFLYP